MLSIRDLTYHVHDDGGDKDILKNVAQKYFGWMRSQIVIA